MSQHEHTNYTHIAELYKILANAKRLAILNALKGRELPVDALAKKVKIRESNVSQHLNYLRNAKFVKTRREGLRIYYRLADPKILKSCVIMQTFYKKKNS